MAAKRGRPKTHGEIHMEPVAIDLSGDTEIAAKLGDRKQADQFIRQQLANSFIQLNKQINFYEAELASVNAEMERLKAGGRDIPTEIIRHRTSICAGLKTISSVLGNLSIQIIKEKNLLSSLDEDDTAGVEVNVLMEPPRAVPESECA